MLIRLPGPEKYVEAAAHFYRALRVYPQPVELLMSESRDPMALSMKRIRQLAPSTGMGNTS